MMSRVAIESSGANQSTCTSTRRAVRAFVSRFRPGGNDPIKRCRKSSPAQTSAGEPTSHHDSAITCSVEHSNHNKPRHCRSRCRLRCSNLPQRNNIRSGRRSRVARCRNIRVGRLTHNKWLQPNNRPVPTSSNLRIGCSLNRRMPRPVRVSEQKQ